MIERTPERAYLDLQKLARDQGRNTQQSSVGISVAQGACREPL